MNASKCQVIQLGSNSTIVVEVGECSIDVVNSVSLLGIKIDSKLNFNQHVFHICQKKTAKLVPFLLIVVSQTQRTSLSTVSIAFSRPKLYDQWLFM